jgi:hypothetical protein
MKIQRQLSNGTMWTDEDEEDRVNSFLDRALQFENFTARRQKREPATTREEALAALAAGYKLQYDTDWYAYIRDVDAPKPEYKKPAMVKCDCGHAVFESLVMHGTHGTCCPDCYDCDD